MTSLLQYSNDEENWSTGLELRGNGNSNERPQYYSCDTGGSDVGRFLLKIPFSLAYVCTSFREQPRDT